jgi:predicted transcriptional regulator
MSPMGMSVKDEVRKLAEKLPLDVTWDQVMYEIYVRQKIDEGERAIAEGRTIPHEEVRKRFGLA